MKHALTRAAVGLLRAIGRLPYPWLRAFGNGLGSVLYWAVAARRRVALVNLAMTMPQLSERERRAIAHEHFRCYTRSFLDRFYYWYASRDEIRALIRLEGEEHLQALDGEPVIVLAPHFVGLDAGGSRLSLDRRFSSMYSNQSNDVLNEVIREARGRFNDQLLFSRQEGLRSIIRHVREGVPLYFLPDMDFGPRDAVFVPFFGVQAATVTSLARIAGITHASVIPCITRMNRDGYTTTLLPPLQDFPGDDPVAATRRINELIESHVRTMPAQYLWTHKRFKTRPPGEPDPYRHIPEMAAGDGR